MEQMASKDSCIYCGKKTMGMIYIGDYRYRIFCASCQKKFDFNARSSTEAKQIYRNLPMRHYAS